MNGERLKATTSAASIEIAAAIVWRVRNTAQAVFDVEDYDEYVRVQAETSVRYLASSYAYDEGEHEGSDEPTLRASQSKVTAALIRELADRLEPAGIVVEDAKLNHWLRTGRPGDARRQQAERSCRTQQDLHGALAWSRCAQSCRERHRRSDSERRAAMGRTAGGAVLRKRYAAVQHRHAYHNEAR